MTTRAILDGLVQRAPVCPPELRARYGIALVGCGEVATTAHLPAYRASGYRVEMACDVDASRAESAARAFGISRWTDRLDEVLDSDDVDIVDLAVRPRERPALARRIAASGKHLLAQKPLATTLAEAEEIVVVCREAGIKLMVNHQARWATVHRSVKALIDGGHLGHIYGILHVYRDWQDFPGSWFVATEHATLLDHGIHYVDLCRHFAGRDPVAVCAAATMVPGQHALTPMNYSIIFHYEPDALLTSTLHFNNIVAARPSHSYEWLVDGSDGSVRATLSEITYYPARSDGQFVRAQIDEPWFPNAFGTAMGELIGAIDEDREPRPSGEDGVRTMQVALASVEAYVTSTTVPVPPARG